MISGLLVEVRYRVNGSGQAKENRSKWKNRKNVRKFDKNYVFARGLPGRHKKQPKTSQVLP